MLKLLVNGESKALSGPCSLHEALERLGHEGGGFAVAVNGTFVPRHRYASLALKGGERLEVLSPMQGG